MARILVVEDEIIVAWDIKENLEKSGHTVVNLALSGAEAIQSATTDVPDLVLMDIHLEGDIDGIEAGDDIYHRLKIPVVYLTAHADEFTVARATQTNPFGYIVKPFQLQSLQTTIKIALQRHNIELAAQTAQISLGNTLENIGSGIIINDRQGIVTFINAVAQDLTGWSSPAAVGMRVDRVFCLVRETDSNSIENPSLRAMRLNKAVKSPDRSWLVAKDRSETPVVDTATPICTPNGEVIGGIIVFQDNTDRVTTEIELRERNKDLEAFQLKLISQLQIKTAECEQAIICLQLLDSLLMTVWTAPSETAFLTAAIQQLCKSIDADYCWIAIHDLQRSTAEIVCEQINTERQIYPTSKIGKEIDIQLYPEFYDRLLAIKSWIDPPREVIPNIYGDLLTPNAQIAVCPIVAAPFGATDQTEPLDNRVIGEIGIMATGNLQEESFQSQAIIQIFSHAIQLFRKTHPQ
jgi:PAS domain S-box-containing protein